MNPLWTPLCTCDGTPNDLLTTPASSYQVENETAKLAKSTRASQIASQTAVVRRAISELEAQIQNVEFSAGEQDSTADSEFVLNILRPHQNVAKE